MNTYINNKIDASPSKGLGVEVLAGTDTQGFSLHKIQNYPA